MQGEFPPLRELLADERERTNFVAFASESYAQGDVLFLCAVHDFGTTSSNPGDLAQAIYDGAGFGFFFCRSSRHSSRVPCRGSAAQCGRGKRDAQGR